MKHLAPALRITMLSALLVACGSEHMPVPSNGPGASGTGLGGGASVAIVPNYKDNIRPLFEAKCKACHGAGPVRNWLDYDQAFAARDLIYNRVVVKKDMPAAGSLTAEERDLIARWVKGDAPKEAQGGSDTPPAPPAPQPPAPPSPPAPPTPPPPSGPVDPSTLTWKNDVLPIILNRCAICHNEDADPLPNWKDYNVFVSKKDRVLERLIVQKTMPPEGMEIDQSERDLIEAWIKAGTKEGN